MFTAFCVCTLIVATVLFLWVWTGADYVAPELEDEDTSTRRG
jgi:hypothetical protein